MTIEVRRLRKTFGDTAAVAGIDLDIAEGEMLVLLGPSGCGKTTTMRCIAGLESPDSGRIALGGRVVFDQSQGINVPANKRHVGMVFQSYAIWPHMSVYQNVSFPLEMEGKSKDVIARRVHDILKLVGLEGFDDRGASYLSGGQMQRVALARSLVMEPSVLLFDEPLSNLDARLREHLRVQLRELQTQLKITSVYVTHDQREALALADKIVVMQLGHVKQVSDPVTLYRHPRTATIADFLGYSNIFDVTVATRDGGATVVAFEANGVRLSAAGAPPEGTAGIVACVRPDDVSIRPIEPDAATAHLPENAVAGDVLLASFIGSHMQYRIKVHDRVIWEVLSSDVTSSIRVGSRVALHVSPRDVLLLPRE
jgi:iron(III) transport system ATP-binding protein